MGLRIERFGCFGKLPVSREFLVDQARDLSDSRLDRWIGEGLGMAKSLLGPRYDERVTSFSPYWFIWGGGSGARLLAGQLRPSEDGAGRKHPFLIFGYCDSRRAGGIAAANASALSGIADSFESLFRRVTTAATPAEVLDLVRNEPGPAERDGRADYEAWVNSTTAGDFWRDALGAPDDPLRFQVMQAFVETVGPLRARHPREIRLGIRFPVARAPGVATPAEPAEPAPGTTAREPATADDAAAGGDIPAAGTGVTPPGVTAAARDVAGHTVSFWLDMTARRLGRSADHASWFWNSGETGDLYLFFSDPSGAQWTCLVDRDANLDTMSCLDRPYGSDPERRMETSLKHLLESPGATLAEYLQWAGRSVS